MGLNDLLKTFNDERTIVEQGDKYVEKTTEGVSLKGVLQRGRLKLIKEKSLYAAGVGFRPSAIGYPFCKRLKVAQLAGLVEIYDDKPTPRLQTVFDMGHAIHDIFQRYFWEIGLLKGTYNCIKCGKNYDNLVSPTSCPSGIASHDKKCLSYREIQLSNEEYLIRGRCDGILVIDGEEHIMDIKSIANRTPTSGPQQWCFEDLVERGPKPDHVKQLTLYMWMSGVDNGHLLYVAKNTHQQKSFAIPYDYRQIEPFLAEIKELMACAELVKAGKKVTLPSACGNEDCKCHEAFLKRK